ncbi:hypothetical protein J5U22_00171 [Saccharolobus shibatae]|uniref:Uncharacterized protein n=1 Tax=Saccharolobus shibatae TaxID=2286 RepID=A0A8F5BSL2_9CREN|nr:hypothetical protein J5U21_00241 [Saccharolobus shibatae]QXJ33629.1 hypothetical protein J5U22_00171 [Saccharolobus shibatae]
MSKYYNFYGKKIPLNYYLRKNFSTMIYSSLATLSLSL